MMHIDVELVRRLIETQFPHWAKLPIEAVAPGGSDNRTFRLGDMVVRLPSAEAYAMQVDKEQRWLPILAPMLPIPIPVPLAMGHPAEGYPWHWSVYRWLEGEPAHEDMGGRRTLARPLADFLIALQRIDATGGPRPGPHNFYRGGPLSRYDREVRVALAALSDRIPTEAVADAWVASLAAPWHGPPLWLHGDVSSGNLLVENGKLSGVIDFGCCGVGDPACDLAIAWTFFDEEARAEFRAALAPEPDTWLRGRGWALWKALIGLADFPGNEPNDLDARFALEQVLADHARGAWRLDVEGNSITP